MSMAWSKLTREQRRIWGFIGGGFVAATVFKGAYFMLSRSLIKQDTERQHLDGMDRLKEAREFAEWSRKDREKRVPKLTEEQKEQMQDYLKLVGKHGFTQVVENKADCLGCPVLGRAKEALGLRSRAVSRE